MARDLKGSRRDLALVFGDGWMTANEAAKALGRPTGSIFGLVRRMHTERLLEADSDPEPPTRGTQYRLTREATELLRDTLAADDHAGLIVEGQQLLAVERMAGWLAPTRVLGQRSLSGVISWAAELPDGWLLAIAVDAEPFRVRNLAIELEEAGCRCRELHLGSLLSGALLRDQAATLADRRITTR